MKEFSTPLFEDTIAGYTFAWPDLEVVIELDRMNDEGKGEIGIYHVNGTGKELLKYSTINLLSSRTCEQLSKSLEANNSEIDWGKVITYVAGKTIKQIRQGRPVQNINQVPGAKRIKYTLYPFLPNKEPTTLFGAGGKAKSVLADLIAVCVAFDARVEGLPYLIPSQANVLYLDWERSGEVHRQRITAIKRSLEINDDREISYISCDHNIDSIIDYLCKKVVGLNIGLVIIDSQMAATAGMGSYKADSEVASHYYNLIRRFGCTTLTLDHTTKQGMSDNTTETPFGSVVKYNRATCVYSIKSTQEIESDTLHLALKHEKYNLGRKQTIKGIEIEFENNDNDELSGLRFNSFDLAAHAAFCNTIPEWQVIASILKRGPLDCSTIVEEVKCLNPESTITPKRVYDVMSKKNTIFVKLDGKMWGLAK